MRARILAFVERLRAGGVDISVVETVDAVAAVSAAGVEREVLREALAACLVKDEADRASFDALFDEMFPLLRPGAVEHRRRRGAGGGAGQPAAGAPRGTGAGAGGAGRARDDAQPAAREARPIREASAPRGAPRTTDVRREDARRPHEASPRDGHADGRRRTPVRVRELLRLPFRDFTSRDVEEARALVRELGARLRGRLARRLRHARRGRLDFRRTLRAATPSGGVPLRLRFRARRPGRPDLVALCDVSGSVAAASELLLGLVAPAAAYFRRVHLFAYVDRLCPVSIEDGHVAPEGALDLHARSDFGRVLGELVAAEGLLTRSTLVLVLGDARNNRLPPRADLLRAVRDRVQRVVWLVPEPRVRWDTGDSVLRLYAPACDAVLECVDLGALVRAVRRIV